jgi:hypothetical protein
MALRAPTGFFLALGALLTGCADGDDGSVATDEVVSSSPHPFDVNVLMARAKASFPTPSGPTEICVIAGHFIEDGFSAKDKKKEEKLCRIDWNASAGQQGVIAAGLSPKANSTNPAIDVHEITTELSRDVIESFSEANARDRKGKKLGRLKSSLDPVRFDRTSSYGPSIVGYYGTSRMLGNIAEVTPAVWRTLEVGRHAKVAELGKRLTVPGSQIVKNLWSSFLTLDTQSGNRGALTYTVDGSQIYGALIPSVSGDDKDKEIDTLAGLTRSPRFQKLTDARPIASSVPGDLKGAVQAIVPMQGVVEMLVLDALMLQGDRLSGDNVSFVPFMYFQKADGSVDRMSKDDFEELQKDDPGAVPPGAVEVKKLYLNDVDAGLVVKNAQSFQNGSEYGLLKRVNHISPELYGRVRKLAGMVQNPEFEKFAKSDWRYTDRDWTRYREMTLAVSTLLHDRCTGGALTLDLDVAKHLAHTNLGPKQGCEP